MTHIAFLRNINVGGRTIKMERLRELFSELGFEGVRTYIQTGNVFFESAEKDRKKLARKIEKHLESALGYAVPTFVRTVSELERSLKPDPFKGVKVTPDTRLLVLFTSEPLPKSLKLPHRFEKSGLAVTILKATPGEAFVVSEQLSGRPGNPAALIEKHFDLKVTGRFSHTTQKILEAAQKSE